MKKAKTFLAIIILLIVLAFTLFLYRNSQYEDYPEVLTNDKMALASLPILEESFKINFYYEENLLTTVGAYLKKTKFPYDKEIINNNDILICLYKHIHFTNAPLVILIPGIYGTVTNYYITNFIELAYQNRINVVCIQFQYQFEDPELVKMIKKISFYSVCNINDTKFAIDYISKNFKYSKLFLLGYSNGAYLSTKYLQLNNDVDIAGAIIVSSPWDIKKNLEFLNSSKTKFIYRNNFINNVKKRSKKIVNYIDDFKKENPDFDDTKLTNPEDLYDLLYPDYFYHNYKTLDTYLAECQALDVDKIKPPVLYIHAKDDPICNWQNMPIEDILKNNKDVVVLFNKGGHLGWQYYIETLCLQYINYILEKSLDNYELDV